MDVDISIDNVYKKILIYADEKKKVKELVDEFSRK